jgi:DNA polymerase III epsilon subunit-like protein
MPSNYDPLPLWNGNLLCSIDIETSGKDPETHEIVQLAIVPLNWDYTPLKKIKAFNHLICPAGELDPESTKVHGLTMDILSLAPPKERVIDRLITWVNSIDLVFDRRLIMLAHNSSFEIKWLNKFLTLKTYESMFNAATRDSMTLALGINDIAAQRGRRPPFERVSLPWLCTHFGVTNHKAHDAYYDALACAKVYKHLLNTDILL